MVPRTGLEPACLAALPPQGSVSAIPPPGHRIWKKLESKLMESQFVCPEILLLISLWRKRQTKKRPPLLGAF
jgi:hypothetical protein